MEIRHHLIGLQGLYYLVTGLWPLVHYGSFELVSGPKVDDWLVRMVGLLTVVVGAALLTAWRRGRTDRLEVLVLAVGAALAYATIDFRYGLTGRIWRVYLLDGILELALAGAILWLSRSPWSTPRTTSPIPPASPSSRPGTRPSP
jgi:hypothetical protein